MSINYICFKRLWRKSSALSGREMARKSITNAKLRIPVCVKFVGPKCVALQNRPSRFSTDWPLWLWVLNETRIQYCESQPIAITKVIIVNEKVEASPHMHHKSYAMYVFHVHRSNKGSNRMYKSQYYRDIIYKCAFGKRLYISFCFTTFHMLYYDRKIK